MLSWFSHPYPSLGVFDDIGMQDYKAVDKEGVDVPDRSKAASAPTAGRVLAASPAGDHVPRPRYTSRSTGDEGGSLSNEAPFHPPMPWFGMDIGGSLVKLVYFEPEEILPQDAEQDVELSRTIHKYLTSNKTYGDTGIRDAHLEMRRVPINGHFGTLHFIRFPSSAMEKFIFLAKTKGLSALSSTICATGGGAFAYEKVIKQSVNLDLHKSDEIDSLVSGIHYLELNHPEESYFFENPLDDSKCRKVPLSIRDLYPYIVVNVGSGVSVLLVESRTKYQRVWGTSIGGATFLGLCCLLTGAKTFDEAIALAAKGDHRHIDKLVRDIYGGDYGRFQLPGDTVAASFGQMLDPERRKNAKPEDLARAVLVTVTNNIGSMAMMCAMNAKVDKVVFLGNFLRINDLSMKQLSHAMDFWSKGKFKAVFLEHEGYFGAVGCLLEYMSLAKAGKGGVVNV